MRHQCDTRLLDGIITAALGRRDKNDIRIGSQHQFRIEVTFHAYLHDTTVFHASKNIFVEEILRTGDAFHHIMCIENGEV